jgi:hypothetical protein
MRSVRVLSIRLDSSSGVLRAVGGVVTFLVLVVVELRAVVKPALAVTRDWSSTVG